jgi:hypothetical protein
MPMTSVVNAKKYTESAIDGGSIWDTCRWVSPSNFTGLVALRGHAVPVLYLRMRKEAAMRWPTYDEAKEGGLS